MKQLFSTKFAEFYVFSYIFGILLIFLEHSRKIKKSQKVLENTKKSPNNLKTPEDFKSNLKMCQFLKNLLECIFWNST